VSYGAYTLYSSRGRKQRNRHLLGALLFIAVLALPVMLGSRTENQAASPSGRSVAMEAGRRIEMLADAGVTEKPATEETQAKEPIARQAPTEPPATPAPRSVAKLESPKPASSPVHSAVAEAKPEPARSVKAKSSGTSVKARQASKRNVAKATRSAAPKPVVASNTGPSAGFRSRGLVAAPK
jgi:outer membrane biosynthesis protein TonB